MPKRKCKFTDELQAKYPCFRMGRERWEAECLVCQEGTYISVANKGALDLEAHVQSMKHKRNVLGDASVAKLPGCFLPADCQPVDAAAATTAAKTPLGFATAVFQDWCEPLAGSPGFSKTPDPVLDVLGLQIKTEVRLDEALAPFALDCGVDLLDGIPYCGVALGAGNAGTSFPTQICYFDWKQGGVQSRVIGVEPLPGELAPGATVLAWEALESHGVRQWCVAIVGESRNTMLGGLGCCTQGPAEVSSLQQLLEGVFIATDCPMHLLSNCIQNGADSLEVDLQSLVWKIYTYVSVYAVCAELLKDFLEFAKREYQQLLHHARMLWLLLLPAITRLLQVFPALKSFLSLSHPPFATRTFFEDDFSEIYLQHMALQVAVFDMHLRTLAREDNSPCEVLGVFSSIRCTLLGRKAHGFMSLRVKELLAEQQAAERAGDCNTFCHHIQTLYVAFLDYLDARMRPFGELFRFQWMQLRAPSTWVEVEACIKYLADHGVMVDDSKCFDQFCHLTTFLKDCRSSSDFSTLQMHQKWLPGAVGKTLEMSGKFVWKFFERSVEFQITNKTQDVTWYNPRSYCFSAYSSTLPSPRIPPGVTESCQFARSMIHFWGCMGVLVYEADAFMLSILFSNPLSYNIFYVKVAMEISLHKVHLGNLEDIYTRMYNTQPASTGKDTMFHQVKLGTCQEATMVSAGNMWVMATMSSAAKLVIKVIMENQDSSSSESKGGTTH
ncbi:uncharacterized protein [Ciconia boyciana]